MSLGAADLGSLADLAAGLGLLDPQGQPDGSWFSEPASRLKSCISNPAQRAGLLRFVDEVIGGDDATTDDRGRTWLPLVQHDKPQVTVSVVVDAAPEGWVVIGVGATLATADGSTPAAGLRVHIPVVAITKDGHSRPDGPLLPGTPDGLVEISVQLTFATPAPGEAGLQGVNLTAVVPTAAGPGAGISLTLHGLQLPGAGAPQDLTLDLSHPDQLATSARDLLLDLARREAANTGPVAGLAAMLGLTGAVPPLPFDQFSPHAIAAWLEGVVASDTARGAFLAGLTELLGTGAVDAVTGEVTLTLGVAEVSLGLRSAPGATGHPAVSLVAELTVAAADADLHADVELARLDLGTGSVLALPMLEVAARAGQRGAAGMPLIATGDVTVAGVRIGFALDQGRHPAFVLAADTVQILGHQYATLDLSTPDAIAATVTQALDGVLADMLSRLAGTLGDAVGLLIGVRAPPSAPALATLDLAGFFRDPLGALATYWKGLIASPAGMTDVLGLLRDLLADATASGTAIAGTGTAADPWIVPVVGPLNLLAWRPDGAAERLITALSAGYTVATLGQGCTKVGTSFTVTLADLDLAAGHASLLPGARAALTLTASDGGPIALDLGGVLLEATSIGLQVAWAAGGGPEAGLQAGFAAPGLALDVDGTLVPLPVPQVASNGTVTMPLEAWASLETALSLLAARSPAWWLASVVELMGWGPAATGPHLALADLVADPETALLGWARGLAAPVGGATPHAMVALLARFAGGLRGDYGAYAGSGTPADPFVVPLTGTDPLAAPALTLWWAPYGPWPVPVSSAPDALQSWRPGQPGLSPIALGAALASEAAADPGLADLLAGRPDQTAGLAALAARLTGSDGLVVPPATAPAGITVTTVPTSAAGLADELDLETLFPGITPALVVHAGVSDPSAGAQPPAADSSQLVDASAAGVAPDTIALPAFAAGTWWVRLGTRDACRLASGDVDGVAGQAARLSRIVTAAAAAAGAGDVVVIGWGGAGHAVLRTAADVPGVTHAVLAGTPLTAVTANIIDTNPAADTLRLLAAVLPPLPDPNAPPDPDTEPDDADLAAGRSIVSGLLGLSELADPVGELGLPPSTGTSLPAGIGRAGLAVDAVYGVLGDDDVARAVTAVLAAGLAARARHRTGGRGAPSELRIGMRVPLPTAPAGPQVIASGRVDLDLLALTSGTSPQLQARPRLRARLGIGAAQGWLVGGPGADRSQATVRETELRRAEIVLDVPLFAGAATDDAAAVVLHEARVNQVRRTRWTIAPDAASAIAADAAGAAEVAAATAGSSMTTTLLPEARIALSRLAERLADPASGTIAGWLADLFRAARLIDDSGGFVAESVERLIGDPLAHLRDLRSDPAALSALARAAERFSSAAPAPGTGTAAALAWGPVTLTLDLGAGTAGLAVAETAGRGAVTWSLAAALGPSGPSLTAGLGAAAPASGPAGGLRLELSAPDVRADLVWTGGAAADRLALWPAPDPGAIGRAVARLIPAEVARAGLAAVRELDATAQPIVDAVLDAFGLLTADTGSGRTVRLPAALLADPAGFFRHPGVLGASGGGVDAARMIALLDALRPLLGISGGPGQWQLATGVTVTTAAAGSAVRLGLQLDSTAFGPPPAATDRLTASLDVALLLGAGTPGVDVDIALGTPGAAPGRSAAHLELATGAPVRLYLRPATGADIPLLPAGTGLAGLAATAVTKALPLVLDQLAGMTGAGLAATVAGIVAALGDALAVRSGGKFDPDALSRWGADPLGSLGRAWPAAAAAGLGQLATALAPLFAGLPGGVTVAHDGTGITVSVAGVTVSLQAPLVLDVTLTRPGIPVIGDVTAHLRADATGPLEITAVLGPLGLTVGGVAVAPFLGLYAGASPGGGRRIELGLSLGSGTALVARCLLGVAPTFALLARTGSTDSADPAAIAAATLEAILDSTAAVLIALPDVAALLNRHLGNDTSRPAIRTLLEGSVLSADGTTAATGLADPAQLLPRALTLAKALAAAQPSITVGGLTIALQAASGRYGVRLDLAEPLPLLSGTPSIRLEVDDSWIDTSHGPTPEGLTLWLLADDPAPPLHLALSPGLTIGGIGIRIGGDQAPLLDTGLRIDSVAVHGYLDVEPGALSGGGQLELAGLALGVGGASGGNPVAHGLLADTGSGNQKLAPSFSPAIAVQRHASDPVLVSFRAGPGDGPWWLLIQRSFGPVYVEQVGLAVTLAEGQIRQMGILLDGQVSILGLTAAVDGLQVSFVLGAGSAFAGTSWQVDLAGLAISADTAGLSLEGGLRKFEDSTGVQYVGMLLGRFAVYGISVYGGYGRTADAQGTYASFFAFGAINGPIGGVPAFFVTGIGGGLGINRLLIVPTDLSKFGDYPLIKALDPAAQPSPDPMQDLTRVAGYFPPQRGAFWFAAGVSFTSFALVDGVAVLAVQIGDGLEIDLLGLARMALPRPQFAIVSIEVALVVRFSTRDGILWVQAQLTDNSWLLYPDVRLTGGFAYVIWFGGALRGEFVFTLGGYHPDFHRDGYPQVPRLGFQWQWEIFTIKGGAYFALTSDAVMAGGSIEASADFDVASVSATLSADGIVYFDPFHFCVVVSATVTGSIDLWIFSGSVSVTATITVEGPQFHGTASVDLGPTSVTVEFGDPGQEAWRLLGWLEFVQKYLELGAGGAARALASVAGRGSQPGAISGGTQAPTPDGTSAHPFVVVAEFELTLASTIPLTVVRVRGALVGAVPGDGLGVAPMGLGSLPSSIDIGMAEVTPGSSRADAPELSQMQVAAAADGRFPPGVWGLAKPQDDPPLPTGSTVAGISQVTLTAEAAEGHGLGPYAYDKVETGAHLPLPFGFERVFREPFLGDVTELTDLVPAEPDTSPALFAAATDWLARSGPSRTALRAYAGERVAPPRLGALTDRLTPDELPVPDVVTRPIDDPPPDRTILPPEAAAMLSAARQLGRTPLRTTVTQAPDGTPRTAPPTLATASLRTDVAVAARLVLRPATAANSGTSLLPRGAAPATGGVGAGAEALARAGAPADAASRLARLSASFAASAAGAASTVGAAADTAQQMRVGEVSVLRLPSVAVDDPARPRPALALSGAACRVVALGPGGAVLGDSAIDAAGGQVTVPVRTERLVVAATGAPQAPNVLGTAGQPPAGAPGLLGWHGGQALPYVGWATMLAAGAVVTVEGDVARRRGRPVSAGFVLASSVVTGDRLVRTRFAAPVATVVVVIDAADTAGAAPEGLVTGIDGATRLDDAPTLVVAGGRSHLVYAVASQGPVTVTVGADPRWELAGVLGSGQQAADVAALLARLGLDDAVAAPVVAGAEGTVQVAWVPPAAPAGAAAPAGPGTSAGPAPAGPGTQEAADHGAAQKPVPQDGTARHRETR